MELVDTSNGYLKFTFTLFDTITSELDTIFVRLKELSDTTYHIKTYEGPSESSTVKFQGTYDYELYPDGTISDLNVIADPGFSAIGGNCYTCCVKEKYTNLTAMCNDDPDCWFACKAVSFLGIASCDKIIFAVSAVSCIFGP